MTASDVGTVSYEMCCLADNKEGEAAGEDDNKPAEDELSGGGVDGDGSGDSRKCSICLCNLHQASSSDSVVAICTLPCSHAFHASCMDEFLASAAAAPALRCPLCRATLKRRRPGGEEGEGEGGELDNETIIDGDNDDDDDDDDDSIEIGLRGGENWRDLVAWVDSLERAAEIRDERQGNDEEFRSRSASSASSYSHSESDSEGSVESV